MPSQEPKPGLERLLEAAEALFIEQGYSAVKLKHIAEQIEVKESAIYYHFPKGKEALFIAVMQRNFARHQVGIQAALQQAGMDWIAQLRAIGYWLVSQPALDVLRMSKADLPAIDAVAAAQMEETIYTAIHLPIRQVLDHAVQRGLANVADTDLVAGVLIGMIAALELIKPAWNPKSKIEMVDILLDSWINGLRRSA
jgi:AcrR family transcriptional regulator